MEGYNKGKPDVEWWMSQIRAGEKFRDHYAVKNSWNEWRNMYRSNFVPGIFPKNVMFTMRRTLVPRIYFRNPSVSIVSAKPGAENQAISKILERIDNKMFRHMNIKTEMKRMVDKAFVCGTAIGKIGYGAEFTPTPEIDGTSTPIAKDGGRVEYRTGVEDNMPWFRALNTDDFVVPAGLGVFEDAYFVAHRIRRPVDDVRRDSRLDGARNLSSTKMGKNWRESDMGPLYDPRPFMDLWEIRDKRTRKVIVVSPDAPDSILYYGDDELQRSGSVPFFPAIFNEDDEIFWGVPDAKILEPYQLEINEIKTQMMKHRRLSIIKTFYEKGAIAKEEIQKMLEETVNAAVEVNDIGKVLQTQISQIPRDLFAMDDAIMQDIRETMGFSRNQFGEFAVGSADRTATEAQIVRQASEIRVDERRDKLADVTVDITKAMNSIIFNHWTDEQVIDVIGPDGLPIWVSFQASALRDGKFDVKVDPDSSVPETKQLREQKATQMYQILLQNPLVQQDPFKVEKITRFLIHENQGYALDDLLDPQVPGSNPQNPVDVNGLGQLLQTGGLSGRPSPLAQVLGG